MKSIIQLHADGAWHDSATLESHGRNECFFNYLPDYIFGDVGQKVSFTLPVSFESRYPFGPSLPFLLDLVPQSNGRKYLIQKLGLVESDDLIMPLVQNGAFNPIGRLRINTAVDFFNEHLKQMSETEKTLFHTGFNFKDIVGRKEEFVEQMALHGMMGAGTTGLQGAAPKFMLTKSNDDLWFVDMALKDENAQSHWIVKLPRGKHESDESILRNEACYLNVAHSCGLRFHKPSIYAEGMLFIERFDRIVKDGNVIRLHQESLASVAKHNAFGARTNHFDLVDAFKGIVSSPTQEIAEYLKRDILNLAIRNTDNHARNTALQQLPDGTVQLTPIFDIAPMFLDREMIARSCRWLDINGHEIADLNAIIDALKVDELERIAIREAIRDFINVVESLPDTMRESGVDDAIIEQCKYSIEKQVNNIAAVTSSPSKPYKP